jgi:hypothetical protein
MLPLSESGTIILIWGYQAIAAPHITTSLKFEKLVSNPV